MDSLNKISLPQKRTRETEETDPAVVIDQDSSSDGKHEVDTQSKISYPGAKFIKIQVAPGVTQYQLKASTEKKEQPAQEPNQPDPKPKHAELKRAPPPAFDDANWKWVLENNQQCFSVEGLRETHHYHKLHYDYATSGLGERNRLKKILLELSALEGSLPTNPAIWVAHDEDCPQFIRALIAAPSDTPYAYGLFCFDIFMPNDYPKSPPKVNLMTTGGGTVRFGPNLYADGKVCLSLLNTWKGPKWQANESSLLQVLVSIQGLILGVKNPYFLEPGFGGWGEPTHGMFSSSSQDRMSSHVREQEYDMRVGTSKYAILDILKLRQKYLLPFEKIIKEHFACYKEQIEYELEGWLSMQVNPGKLESVKNSLEQFKNLTSKTVYSAASSITESDESKKPAALPTNRKQSSIDIGSIAEMKRAAEQEDFDTVARIHFQQRFHKHFSLSNRISAIEERMHAAAKRNDFIEAGKLQKQVQTIAGHEKILSKLEARILSAAEAMDFVRAGSLHKQYNLLLEDEGSENKDALSPTRQKKRSNGQAGLAPLPPPNGGILLGDAFPTVLDGDFDDYEDEMYGDY